MKAIKLTIPLIALVLTVFAGWHILSLRQRAESEPIVRIEVERQINEVEIARLQQDLYEMILAVYYETLKEAGYEKHDIVRFMTTIQAVPTDEEDEENEEENSQFEARITAAVEQWSTMRNRQGFQYVSLLHNDALTSIGSGHPLLEGLLFTGVDESQVWDLLIDFMEVYVIRFNENGRMEIVFATGLSNDNEMRLNGWLVEHGHALEPLGTTGRVPGMRSTLFDFNVTHHEDAHFAWLNPRNMTIAIGIPSHLYSELYLFEQHEMIEQATFDRWTFQTRIRHGRESLIATMLLLSVAYLFVKNKQEDKWFNKLSRYPLEVVTTALLLAIGTLSGRERRLAWANLHDMSFFLQLFIYLSIFFVVLTLIGYFILSLKELYVLITESKLTQFKKRSLVYRYGLAFKEEYLQGDFTRRQTLKLAIAYFGLWIALPLAIIIIPGIVFGGDGFYLGLFVLLPLYVFGLFFYLLYFAAKTKRHFCELKHMTKDLAAGHYELEVPEDLGYFDELKHDLATIKDGLSVAVETKIKAERTKSELITNVSHDLKTPLTSIISYVDLLQVEGLEEEKRQQYLATLALKTDRLKHLVEDLFEVSKATAGHISLHKTEVDVVTLMKQTVVGLMTDIEQSGLDLRESYAAQPLKLELDGSRMHRVFENLIVNMTKYAMPRTRAYIHIEDEEDEVVITFRNISNHELDMDFTELAERFVRGDVSRHTEGSGLGLAIAKSFVEVQGGTLTIAVDGDLFKVIITFKK